MEKYTEYTVRRPVGTERFDHRREHKRICKATSTNGGCDYHMNVHMTYKQIQAVRKCAAIQNRSCSAVARDALRAYLADVDIEF